MADTVLWAQAAGTSVAVDGDTGWLDSSALNTLALDITVEAVVAPAVTADTQDGTSPAGGPTMPSDVPETVFPGTPPQPVPHGTYLGGVPKGGVGNIEFYLEAQDAAVGGETYLLWESGGAYEPHKFTVGVGPSLPIERQVPPAVRVRWVLNGGSVTFGAALIGR